MMSPKMRKIVAEMVQADIDRVAEPTPGVPRAKALLSAVSPEKSVVEELV